MGLIVLIIFICCGYYAQTRGKVRHESLSRMITDHSNLFSPINCLNYGFSRVENTPYLSPKEFPDLQIFEDNWEIIKEEAMSLYDNSQITASAKLNDVGFNSFFKTGPLQQLVQSEFSISSFEGLLLKIFFIFSPNLRVFFNQFILFYLSVF